MTVRGIERLGGAKAVLGERTVGYLDEAEQIGEEAFRFQVKTECPPPGTARFAVGAAGPGWPQFDVDDDPQGPIFHSRTDLRDPLPVAGAGNIENGVGFLGGTVIKSVAIPVVQ